MSMLPNGIEPAVLPLAATRALTGTIHVAGEQLAWIYPSAMDAESFSWHC